MQHKALTYIPCPICDSSETSPPIAVQRGWPFVRCRQCGLVYMNVRPTQDELIELYNSYHQRNGKDAESWGALMRLNLNEVAAELTGMFPEKGTLLDIGCGYGHFIGQMQSHGWKVSGIEPSGAASVYAQAKGLDVSRTVFETAEFPSNSFDAITAFYVLEHLYNPLAALKKMHALLRPRGVLVLRVPHTTPIVGLLSHFSVSNDLYDAPFHLQDFSPKTLRLALSKAGFDDVRITPGQPTLPSKRSERIVSLVSGTLAQLLFSASGGRMLLPGVSKTVIARKPSGRREHTDA